MSGDNNHDSLVGIPVMLKVIRKKVGTRDEDLLNHEITNFCQTLPVRTSETFVPQVEFEGLVSVSIIRNLDGSFRLGAVAQWVLAIGVWTAFQATSLDFGVRRLVVVVVAVVVVVLGFKFRGAPNEIRGEGVVELCGSWRIRNLGRKAEGEDGKRSRVDHRALPVVKWALEVHGFLEIGLITRGTI